MFVFIFLNHLKGGSVSKIAVVISCLPDVPEVVRELRREKAAFKKIKKSLLKGKDREEQVRCSTKRGVGGHKGCGLCWWLR